MGGQGMINKNSKHHVAIITTHDTLNVGYMHEHVCVYHFLAMYTMPQGLSMQLLPCTQCFTA